MDQSSDNISVSSTLWLTSEVLPEKERRVFKLLDLNKLRELERTAPLTPLRREWSSSQDMNDLKVYMRSNDKKKKIVKKVLQNKNDRNHIIPAGGVATSQMGENQKPGSQRSAKMHPLSTTSGEDVHRIIRYARGKVFPSTARG